MPWCACLVGLLAAGEGRAAQIDAYGIQQFELDLSFKSGIAFGSMKKPEKGTDPAGNFDFSGVPMAIALNVEPLSYLSFFTGAQILVDVGNDVVSRKGADIGGCAHVLGGSRRAIVEKSKPLVIISHNAYNLSVCNRMSYFVFSVSNKDDLEQSIQGEVLEDLVGVNFRLDLTPESALGAEVFNTVKAIPASDERVTSGSTEILMYLRTFI